MYLEDSKLGINITCKNPDTGAETMADKHNSNFMEALLPEGSDCTIGLFHFSKELLNRRIYLNDKVRATLLIARRSTAEKYASFHTEGLQHCPTN